MGEVVLVAHDVRSAHNVGSLFRTSDGLGIKEVILSGYTPYPPIKSDTRLPHIAQRAARQIHKTALGAEESVHWRHVSDIYEELDRLKRSGYVITALEQSKNAIALSDYAPRPKTVLIVGSEVAGIDEELLDKVDAILEIPMRGRKESFNVAAAAAMALYHLTYLDKKSA